MITATTKTFEIIPDADGNQILTIPKGLRRESEKEIDNPHISVSDPITSGSRISFGIRFVYFQGSVEHNETVSIDYTYDEIFAILNNADFSVHYNSRASNTPKFLGYLMTAMANVYDTLLQEVDWLKGKIQEVK